MELRCRKLQDAGDIVGSEFPSRDRADVWYLLKLSRLALLDASSNASRELESITNAHGVTIEDSAVDKATKKAIHAIEYQSFLLCHSLSQASHVILVRPFESPKMDLHAHGNILPRLTQTSLYGKKYGLVQSAEKALFGGAEAQITDFSCFGQLI